MRIKKVTIKRLGKNKYPQLPKKTLHKKIGGEDYVLVGITKYKGNAKRQASLERNRFGSKTRVVKDEKLGMHLVWSGPDSPRLLK